MIDLKLLQKDFDTMSAKLTRKGVDVALLEKLKEKSEELKVAKINFETLQALQNSMSKEFGVYKREGKDISELKAKVDANKIEIAKVLDIQREKTAELESMAMAIPNVPDAVVIGFLNSILPSLVFNLFIPNHLITGKYRTIFANR